MQSKYHLISLQEAFSAEWLSAWGPLLTVVVATAGIITSVRMAMKAIKHQTENNLIAKRLDALIECNNRYAEVSEQEQALKRDAARSETAKAAHVYRTYWSVQYEQWQFFDMGVLAARDLQIWAKVRTKQFAQDDQLCGIPLAKTWASVRGYYSHVPKFVSYVDQLKHIGETNRDLFPSDSEDYPDTISDEVGDVIRRMRNSTRPSTANTAQDANNGGCHGQDV